jgi:ligand-binding sensor domain-containing protein
LTFVIFQSNFSVHAQELIFRNLQELDLPSFETYNVMQDSKGYMWIGSDGGLCKYNGKTVKVFDKSKGIFEGSTYTIAEDKYGAIWCTTSQNRILKIINDSVTEAPMSKFFEKKLSKLHLNYFMRLEGDSIFTSSQLFSYYGTLSSNSLALRFNPEQQAYFQVVESGNTLLPIKRAGTAYTNDPLKTGFVCVYMTTKKGPKYLMIPFNRKNSPNWRVCTMKNKSGAMFFTYDNYVVRVNEDFSFSWMETSGEVISLYCDNDDGLWIGVAKGGLYYCANSNNVSNYVHYMSDYSVSGICHDAEGGIWCTTLEKGVFYCRNKSIVSYNSIPGLDKRAGLLRSVNNTVFTSCTPNVIFTVKEQKVTTHHLGSGGNYMLSDVVPFQKGWMISGRNFTYKAAADLKSGDYVRSPLNKMVGSAQLCSSPDGKLYGLSFGNLFEIKDLTTRMIKEPLESPGRSLVFSHNVLLVGLKNGVFKADTETGYFERIDGIDGEIARVLITGGSSVWVCTKDNRLYKLENEVPVNMAERLKLPGTRYYDVAEDRFGTIWIASNVGLICLNNANGKTTASTYNSTHGLPSTIVYEVETTDSSVYVSTPEGLASFPLQAEISNYLSTPIYLNTIRVNDSLKQKGSSMVFAYNENSLKFDFDVLCYKGHSGPVMYYKLLGGNDDRVHMVDGTQIQLDNMRPGKYKLQVYSYNNDGIAGKDPAVITFEVLKPFWKQIWFILLVTVLLAFVIYVVVRRVATNFKNREAEKTRVHKLISEYQLSALQAQMNPHFIFNAINSIQTYILDNDTQIAYDYLAKFAKLVRMVLNHAKEKSISLEKEMELLSMYIGLEQLRFENKFDLVFDVQESLDTYQVELPPMIIQPYVENAIWHGLMPLDGKRKGELKVQIFEKENKVHIIVQDNGIGREASMKIEKTPGYKSIAMELTKERLDVLKSIPGYESASIQIEDLKENGVASGTRVTIIIPLN